MPEIRTAVRTGDTLMHERAKMLKRPPHILVTTPESLYILLTAAKSREILRTVDTVIVDEIHAVADDKRGAHLALSLERLEALTEQPPVRIGLSATQKPIELVAQFLAGSGRPLPVIVQIGAAPRIDLAVEVPASELGPVASNEMWDEIYERLGATGRVSIAPRSFSSTRGAWPSAWRIISRERLGEDAVASHHGSLSRNLRLAAEKNSKPANSARWWPPPRSNSESISAPSISSARSARRARSRSRCSASAARATGAEPYPKAASSPPRAMNLLECAALVRAIRAGDLDRLDIPEAPLDILAQQIVAACAAEETGAKTIFSLWSAAPIPYRNLARAEFR